MKLDKFIRCFAYGLTEGESITVQINGVNVEFTSENAQIDVSAIVPEVEINPEP